VAFLTASKELILEDPIISFFFYRENKVNGPISKHMPSVYLSSHTKCKSSAVESKIESEVVMTYVCASYLEC